VVEGAEVAELPVGTVTFLFTDIEGSTRLWQEQPEVMRPALARHDAILREAIEAYDGRYVKTTGDGAHAAFATASDGIDAAVAAQRAIAAEVWPLPSPLRVRMGLHSGPAELRDGDYYGTTVNRAARIMSVAHGGQVVVSLATQELARDGSTEMLDLGEHRLKDLGQPERIFQVLHADLERDFPPLRSLDSFTTNLPTQRTSFVGREAELAAVKDAIADARLVTLTGVGGVGKTRLAVQAAAEVLADFPEGVWLVELAAVGDPDAVPDAVATTVGLVPSVGTTVTATIAEALAGRRSLLVLDNCEHVVDAAAELVEAILARPGPMTILATSREGLQVADERLWPVPSLGGRSGGGDEASTLFVERSRALSPDFDPDGIGVAEAVDEICRRLDGIPLAIELAAARTISMSVPELRDRLDDRFRLLAGSRRGLERHQTLRHAVQWSFDLLDDDERTVLHRASVFAGGFDLDGVVAMTAADGLDEYAVLDVLDALVRKSLVTADRSSGRTRYGMLETIRQFAEEQLTARDVADLRVLHAQYFAAQVDEVFSWWDDARQADAYAWIERELANLRAAFRAATDADDLDTAASLATAATILGYYAGILEPATWADELVSLARAADHPRLQALCAAAGYANTSGVDTGPHADAAIALADDPHYLPLPFGTAGGCVGAALILMGRSDDWVDFCVGEIARITTSPVYAQTCLVVALLFAGRSDEAAAMSADVVAAAEHHPNATALVGALLGRGYALYDGDPAAAMEAMRRAVQLGQAEHSGARMLAIHAAAFLAQLEADFGDPVAALDLTEQCLRDYYAVGGSSNGLGPMTVLVKVLAAAGRPEPAAVLQGVVPGGLVPGPSYDALRVGLETSLGAAEYERLHREGASMDYAEAIRYGLDQIEQLRAGM